MHTSDMPASDHPRSTQHGSWHNEVPHKGGVVKAGQAANYMPKTSKDVASGRKPKQTVKTHCNDAGRARVKTVDEDEILQTVAEDQGEKMVIGERTMEPLV